MEVYDINTIYNRYKECINSCYSKLKDEVEQIINQKQLYSIMNDAKWLKLQTAILTIPEFEPDYCVQLLTDEIEYSPVTGEAPTYSWGWKLLYEDYEYSPPPFFNIKWMAIRTLDKIDRGRLVAPQIIDKSDILLDILHKCNIPFEKEDNHTFVIYGYK